MTGNLSYHAANEQVARTHRIAGKHPAAKVGHPARGAQRQPAADLRRAWGWGRLRRKFSAS
jgi:hypothetical protein